MATVFVEHLKDENPRMVNSTGAAVVQGQLTVIDKLVLIANQDIASTAVGSFQAMDGAIVQIAATEAVSGQATFGTAGAPAFWKPSTGEFSDTSTSGYYNIGTVVDVKNAAGKIGIRIRLNAVLI
jgi:hypothetical protein